MISLLIHLNNAVSCLKLCFNHRDWNITYRPLVLTNPQATMIYMNTNVLEKPKIYTNKLVSVTTSNNSKILLRLLWFLLLKYSITTVLYLLWHQYQSINHVLGNCCVCLLTFYRWKKLLPVKLELLNLRARQLNTEINHGHWKKIEKGTQKSVKR